MLGGDWVLKVKNMTYNLAEFETYQNRQWDYYRQFGENWVEKFRQNHANDNYGKALKEWMDEVDSRERERERERESKARSPMKITLW